MSNFCLLLSGPEAPALHHTDPEVCADSVFAMSFRFTRMSAKRLRKTELGRSGSAVVGLLQSGKVVGVLTNVKELEADYVRIGAIRLDLPTTKNFLLAVTKRVVNQTLARSPLVQTATDWETV